MPERKREPNTRKKSKTSRKPKRALGYFFASVPTFPYRSRGAVLGQNRPDSCVAACCRMLLHDHGIEIAESYIRDALQVAEGAYISETPSALREFGLTTVYEYRPDLTIEDLKQALQRGKAIVFVARRLSRAGHALLVDKITEDFVFVRDPLPENLGRAYKVALADFLDFWLRPATGCGNAAIIV